MNKRIKKKKRALYQKRFIKALDNAVALVLHETQFVRPPVHFDTSIPFCPKEEDMTDIWGCLEVAGIAVPKEKREFVNTLSELI